MLAFVVRRILIAVPLVVVSSGVVFGLVSAAGEPAPVQAAEANPRLSDAQRDAIRARFDLDEPVLVRWWDWIGDAARLDLGEDNAGQPVWPQLRHGLAVTARLVFVALTLAVLVGIGVGVFSALRQYSVFDHTATFLSFVFFSLPVFWLAVLLKLYGGIRLNEAFDTRFFFTVGYESPDLPVGLLARIGDYAGHTILPAISLILVSSAQYSRYVRASMLEALDADYVRTARAKGVRASRVVVRHALRNGLLPLTTVVALDFGAVLGGVVITETVFQWRGMGVLFVDGLRELDVYKVSGWLLVAAVAVVVFNIVADVLYAILDPRIRR